MFTAAWLLVAMQGAGLSGENPGSGHSDISGSNAVGVISHRQTGGGAYGIQHLPSASLLSRAETKAVQRVHAALARQDYATAATELRAAKDRASGKHGRYAMSVLELQLGQATGDRVMQRDALEAVLGSGLAPKRIVSELEAMRLALSGQPATAN